MFTLFAVPQVSPSCPTCRYTCWRRPRPDTTDWRRRRWCCRPLLEATSSVGSPPGSSSTFRAYDVIATVRSAPPCSSWPSACYCGRSLCPSEPPWSTPSCSDGSLASPLLNAPTCCAISSAPIDCPAPWACVSPPHRVSESSSVIRRR